MKQSAEQAQLILDNRQALSGAGRARTVYGVNFRELLGSMYNKYNKFLIVLNTYSAHSGDWPNSAGYSNVGTVRMVGLNWAHSSYGVMNVSQPNPSGPAQNNLIMPGNNAEAAFPFLITLADNASVVTNVFTNQTGLCFNKPTEEITQLEVFFRDFRANDLNSTIPYDHYYQCTMSFSIYGLYD